MARQRAGVTRSAAGERVSSRSDPRGCGTVVLTRLIGQSLVSARLLHNSHPRVERLVREDELLSGDGGLLEDLLQGRIPADEPCVGRAVVTLRPAEALVGRRRIEVVE